MTYIYLLAGMRTTKDIKFPHPNSILRMNSYITPKMVLPNDGWLYLVKTVKSLATGC